MQTFCLPENSQELLLLQEPSHADVLKNSGLFDVLTVGTQHVLRPALNRVGIVAVGGTRYEVTPKLPVSQLFYLMSYSAKDPFLNESYSSDEKDLWNLIAKVFLSYTHRAVGRGLLYDYVSVDDALPLVKGSIRVGDQMARRPLVPIPLEVTYDDYSPNILENKILKSALARVLMMPGLAPGIRQGLRALEVVFDEVDALPRGARVPEWQENRRNKSYRPALKLATMILNNMSPGEGTGKNSMLSFVVNLPGIFEDFLEATLQKALAAHQVKVTAQNSEYLDKEKRIKIRPDLIFQGDASVRAIADAKYKMGDTDKSAANADIYQMITYCKYFGLDEGHLILAGSRQGSFSSSTSHLPEVGVTLHTHYLDLGAEPAAIENQVTNLAAKLLKVT